MYRDFFEIFRDYFRFIDERLLVFIINIKFYTLTVQKQNDHRKAMYYFPMVILLSLIKALTQLSQKKLRSSFFH